MSPKNGYREINPINKVQWSPTLFQIKVCRNTKTQAYYKFTCLNILPETIDSVQDKVHYIPS